jgi:hypothetical protein
MHNPNRLHIDNMQNLNKTSPFPPCISSRLVSFSFPCGQTPYFTMAYRTVLYNKILKLLHPAVVPGLLRVEILFSLGKKGSYVINPSLSLSGYLSVCTSTPGLQLHYTILYYAMPSMN